MHEHSHSGFADHGHVHGASHDDHSHSHSHEPSHSHVLSGASDHLSPEQIWRDTIGSVLAISVLPAIALWAIPDLNKRPNLLKVLLGFAAGGLLGDAFLHLIPHALTPHSHSDDVETREHGKEHGHAHLSEHTTVPLWVIGGIFGFLCIDKLLRFLNSGGHHKHSHTMDVHAKSSGVKDAVHIDTTKQKSISGDEKGKKKKKSNGSKKDGQAGDNEKKTSTKNKPATELKDHKEERQNNTAKQSKKKKERSGLLAAGYLNLAADFTHNFTDGIAIAGSFLAGRNIGWVTSLTVLIHELPHEVGDYAILIQSGCGAYKAMLLQLVTAIGALLGASLSLIMAGVGVDTSLFGFGPTVFSPELFATRLLPLTAGGFIYIALASVIPELLNSNGDSAVHAKPNISSRFAQSCAELGALFLGVFLMVVITVFE
nr:unnamed protein product [Spirometra erinaceieuropaei]